MLSSKPNVAFVTYVICAFLIASPPLVWICVPQFVDFLLDFWIGFAAIIPLWFVIAIVFGGFFLWKAGLKNGFVSYAIGFSS
jgi:hypothetical protein